MKEEFREKTLPCPRKTWVSANHLIPVEVNLSAASPLQEQRKNVSQLNPSFGDVSFFPDGVTSNYQALQIKFQRSISPGVQALASYTWAHSLDYGSTNPLYPLTHGNSDLDVRHNLEAAISWDLPKPSKSLFLKYVHGSWGLDGRLIARTAFPVTLFGNLFPDPETGDRYYNGVDLIPKRHSTYTGQNMLVAGSSMEDQMRPIRPSVSLMVQVRGTPRGILSAVSMPCRPTLLYGERCLSMIASQRRFRSRHSTS